MTILKESLLSAITYKLFGYLRAFVFASLGQTPKKYITVDDVKFDSFLVVLLSWITENNVSSAKHLAFDERPFGRSLI